MTQPNPDTDLIEIPSDLIALGVDTDGTPMAVPTEKAKANGGGAPNGHDKEPAKTVTLAEFHAQQEIAAAERKAREEAEAVAKAEREKLAETEKKLGTRTQEAIGAHYHKTLSDYRSAYSDVQQLASAVASTEALAASKEKEYAAAAETGDHARMAAVQREMARLEAEKVTLENGRSQAQRFLEESKAEYDRAVAAFSSNATAGTAEPKRDEPKPQQQVVPQTADDLIVQSPAATRPWLKEHREFATPGTKEFRRLSRFVDEYLDEHNDDRNALNDPAFVKALNDKFFPEENDMAEPEHEGPVIQQEQPKPKARALPAAPVRGSTTNVFSSTNMNARAVRLPPKLKAQVEAMGLDVTKYALQAVEDIKEGKLPKNFLDPDYPH